MTAVMTPEAEAHRFAAVLAALTRWRVRLLAIGLGLLTIGMIFRLHTGINPASLWLDDQWVAALVMHASLPELIELRSPGPIGFFLLLKAVTAVTGPGSWQLQLLAMVMGPASIAMIGWIAFRLTDRASLGLFAAALLAGSRTLAVQSLRVKQFTLEGFIVLVLIALAMLFLRRLRLWRLCLLLIAAVAAIGFSFTAAAVGLVVVNCVALHVLVSRHGEGKISLPVAAVLCAAYDMIALACVALLRARQANELIVLYWSDFYLPLNDPAAWWPFLATHFLRFLTGALPSTLIWFALGVPLGIALLCVRKNTRLIGLALLLFYGGMLAASAFHLYPLGGGRTDIFSYPVTVLTITAAAWALSRWVRFLPQAAMIIVIVEILLFFPAPRVTYPSSDGRSAIEMANERVRDGDALVVAPRDSWALGCYGRWPVRLVRAEESSNGFVVEVLRQHTLILRESVQGLDYRSDPSVVQVQLEPFLALAPRRVFFLSIGRVPSANEWIEQIIAAHGYEARPSASPGDGMLVLFERRAAEPQQSGDRP